MSDAWWEAFSKNQFAQMYVGLHNLSQPIVTPSKESSLELSFFSFLSLTFFLIIYVFSILNIYMSSKYWFRPKRYGYGFYPISWQWWAMTFFLVGLIVLSAYTNNFMSPNWPTMEQGARYLLDLIIFLILFTLISINKTEGELKWNWGKEKK